MTDESENKSTDESTDKPKNKTLIAIIALGILISVFLGHRYVVYLFELPARSSSVRETTTQPVPFDAERREQVRNFVADEIDRQTGQSHQQFNALASALITAVATLIAVALAVFGLTWLRQSQEYNRIIDEAEKYRKEIKDTAVKIAEYEKRSKDCLEQIEEAAKEAQNVLQQTKDERKQSEEAASSAKADMHFTQALTYQNEGELDKAIEEYGRSIAAKESSVAYNNRGNCWAEKEEFDKAITDYNKAIELDPKFALAYNNRGLIWDDKGDFDKAIADFNKAIELNPKDARFYSNRGVTWRKKGEFDKATADYDKAIELDPKVAGFYSNRGAAWAEKGEFYKAIADYDKAIELDPKNTGSYLNNAAEALILKRDFHGAVERLEQGRGRDAFKTRRDLLITSCLEGIALALKGEDASAAEADAKRLQAGGAKAGDWDTEPMERFLKGLKAEEIAPAALATARRFQEMLKT